MADNKKEKVGVQDIADILNISASTVSRALNDHPRISRETKDKVWQVAKRLGYFSGIPEFSSPTKSDAVTILVPSFRSAFYIEVIEGVRDHFEKNGFNVFVLDTRNDDAKAAGFFKKYKNYGTSGVIHIVCNRNIPAGFYSIPLSEQPRAIKDLISQPRKPSWESPAVRPLSGDFQSQEPVISSAVTARKPDRHGHQL